MVARRCSVLVIALVFTSALAQQVLKAPNYYLFQVPRLVAGTPVHGELTLDDGQNFKDGSHVDVYAIEGVAGEHVSIQVASDEFDTYVTLFDPDGYLVASNDDYDSMASPAGIDVTFYVDGLHLLVVSGYSQWDLGAYTIDVRASAAGVPTERASIDVPTSFVSTITADMPLHPNGYMGPTEYFSLTVSDDALLVITLSSDDFDTVLTVFDADGNEVAQNDDYNFSSDSQAAVQLAPGSYVVAASSYYLDGAGDYLLTIERYVRAP